MGFSVPPINASERIALPDMDASDIEARMDLAIVEFVHVNRREPTQIEMEIILSGGSAQAIVAILERHLLYTYLLVRIPWYIVVQ